MTATRNHRNNWRNYTQSERVGKKNTEYKCEKCGGSVWIKALDTVKQRVICRECAGF